MVDWDLAGKVSRLFIIGTSSVLAEVTDENQEIVVGVCTLHL
jgi:hypothetical protein